MAIGTTAAIVGAATIGGAFLSSRAQKKAAGQAADTSAAATASNNALARDIYGQNAARLDPYASRGMVAGNALHGLLGIGGTSPLGAGAPAGGGTWGSGGAFGGTNPQAAWTEGALSAMLAVTGPKRSAKAAAIADPAARLRYLQSVAHPDERAAYQAYMAQNPMPTATATAPATGTPATGTPATPGQTPQQAALSAFDTFRNSTNYQWRFGEGNKALQMSALPGGGFDSGATRRALLEYGQNFASNELGTYMDRLAQQQQMGLGAASALAGVGQNFVGQVSANNNSAASSAANAALMQGQANANMWGGIARGIGGVFGSSYGG